MHKRNIVISKICTYFDFAIVSLISILTRACIIKPGSGTRPSVFTWIVSTIVWWVLTIFSMIAIGTQAFVRIYFVLAFMTIAGIRDALIYILK
jgi:hypothetical protein